MEEKNQSHLRIYLYNNPLIWYISDSGKWHPIDGLITTMM